MVCHQSIDARSIPSLRKKGIGRPAGISPIVRAASNEHSIETIVITISATSVAGTFLVRYGNAIIIAIVNMPRISAITLMPSAHAAGKFIIISNVLTGDFLPISG